MKTQQKIVTVTKNYIVFLAILGRVLFSSQVGLV